MHKIILYLGLAALISIAVPAAAQDWPDYASTTVNDYADLLDDAAEARLDQQLSALRRDTGVEMTVLTILDKETYTYGMTATPTIEEAATGIFNQWGIGDAARNDGVLVLVARRDREMRIELGAAYGQDWNAHAARVIERSFLPAFREDRYQDGIEAGVTDTIDGLVTPFLAGDKAPKSGPDIAWLLIGGAIAFIFGRPLFGAARDRFARCPQCGTRGLDRRSETLRAATREQGGRLRKHVSCSSCGYADSTEVTTSRKRASSSSSFGGGSSGGGGATGRW